MKRRKPVAVEASIIFVSIDRGVGSRGGGREAVDDRRWTRGGGREAGVLYVGDRWLSRRRPSVSTSDPGVGRPRFLVGFALKWLWRSSGCQKVLVGGDGAACRGKVSIRVYISEQRLPLKRRRGWRWKARLRWRKDEGERLAVCSAEAGRRIHTYIQYRAVHINVCTLHDGGRSIPYSADSSFGVEMLRFRRRCGLGRDAVTGGVARPCNATDHDSVLPPITTLRCHRSRLCAAAADHDSALLLAAPKDARRLWPGCTVYFPDVVRASGARPRR